MLPAHSTTDRRQAVSDTRADTSARARRDCRCLRARHHHGTRGAYKRDRCRCNACTRANALAGCWHRRRVAEQRWHGTSAWACPAGTRRRLQALAAMGWSTRQLARRLGVTSNAIASLRSTSQARVLAATADAVTALYEDCWWRTPPGNPRDHARTETWARKHGWAAPWQWEGRDLDDPATQPQPALEPNADLDEQDLFVVLEFGCPTRPPLAIRRQLAAELRNAGLSRTETAARLHVHPRTIERYEAAA